LGAINMLIVPESAFPYYLGLQNINKGQIVLLKDEKFHPARWPSG